MNEDRINSERRFYYIKTDARCLNPDLGALQTKYLKHSLSAEELEAFQRHAQECEFCAARIVNHKNLEAAMRHHGLSWDETNTNLEEVANKVGLIIVDLSGPAPPQRK